MSIGQRTLLYLFILLTVMILLVANSAPPLTLAVILLALLAVPLFLLALVVLAAYLNRRDSKRSPETGKSISRIDKTLMQAKASWPFDFFPDVLIVDVDEITIVKKIFFFSGWTETVPVSDIRRVLLFKGPFFATLTIEQKSRDKVNIGYLNERDAFAVKELIDGLLLLRQGLVKMPDDAPLSVKREILRQAGRNPEAEKEALKKAL